MNDELRMMNETLPGTRAPRPRKPRRPHADNYGIFTVDTR